MRRSFKKWHKFHFQYRRIGQYKRNKETLWKHIERNEGEEWYTK